MEPIELQALSSVRGGFAAILGALLQAAPGIISAFKGGGGSPAPQTQAPAQPTATVPSGPPQMMASAPSQGPSSPMAAACQCSCNPVGSSVQNNIRIA